MHQRVARPKAATPGHSGPTRGPVAGWLDAAAGRPLEQPVLGALEPRPGHEFGRVRVHADPWEPRGRSEGSSGDGSEREADAIADDLLAGRPPGLRPARSVASPGSVAGWPLAEDRVERVRAVLSGGEPLPGELRARFEPLLGMDLGAVRVHQGPHAALAAEALRAHGFASGAHVVFGTGQFAPGTRAGLHLLAHELAHVAQQGAAGAARIDRKNAKDSRLPASLAEALARATSAETAITAALAALAHSGDLRSRNVPALVAQEGLTVRPLTPRHDATVATPLAPHPPINFFTGKTNYADSVVLPDTTTHTIDPTRTHISVRAGNHKDVDKLLPAAEIQGRVVEGVSEVAHTRAAQKLVAGLTTFDRYRARFNALYQMKPFSGMSDKYDAALSSRGPKTKRSRRIFEAVHAEDPTFAAAYDANVGGIKEQVDTYQGPEGLNLIDSPGLQRLRAATFAFVPPVPAASFGAFKAAINAAATTLTAEDRAEVDRSLDWQLLLDAFVTTAAQRDDIKDVIRTATPPAPPPPPPPGGAAPAAVGKVTPQSFVDSVTLTGPVAPVPAVARTVPVTLRPHSGQANPAVVISSQITVTPPASVVGPSVSPATVWPNAAVNGAPFTPTIAVTGAIGLDAQLALVNGPGGLAPKVPIPKLHFSIDDKRRANMGTGWQPAIDFNDGSRQVPFIAGSKPRYWAGSETLNVKATMPVAPNANPGLTLSIESLVRRGGVTIAGPTRAAYPPGAVESSPVNFVFAPPAVVPPGGDPVEVVTRLLDSTGATITTRIVAMKIDKEATYLKAAAEAVWNADEAHLHSVAAGGFIHFLATGAGAAPGLANQIDRPGHPGKVVIHPMVQRHDSAAYVTAENGGVPDPSKAAYLVKTPPYAPHPDPAHTVVLGTGAGGWTVSGVAAYPGTFILLDRTPDVTFATPRRPDDELQIYAIHEATHFLDPGAVTPIQQYRTEFRAYWMDGRFGPPTKALAPPGQFDARFDPTIPPPGPKSPRANRIFRETYDNPVLYPFCKPNYDANTGHFREQVDAYLVPDGINLILSAQLDNLQARFAAGIGASFAIFRTGVQGFFGVGPPPPGGKLSPAERAFVTQSRAWRDQVDGLAGATGPQKATLKTDMGIP